MEKSPVIFPPFDPRRFDHLNDADVLQRIGALLAKAVLRSGFLRCKPRPASENSGKDVTVTKTIDALDLINDPVERRLARFLRCAGPTAPREVARTLEIPRRTVARKLLRLRVSGVCEVVGHTRAAQYRLCTAHERN